MMKKYALFYSILLALLLSSVFIGLVPQAQGQTPPGPPSGITIFDRSHISFQVRWNAADTRGGAPITGYDVRYRLTSELQVWPHTAHTTDTKIELTGLPRNTSYEVQVRAVSADGNSDWSESGWTTTLGQRAPLTLPSDLVASGITGNSVRVSWIPPYTVGDVVLIGYEVKYQVYATVQGDLEDIKDAGHTGTDPFIVITGLFADTSYSIQVIALTSDGNRHYSPHLYLTTAGFRPDPPSGITVARTPTSIQLNWNAPYTPDDVPITGYDIRYRPTAIEWINGIPLRSPFVEVHATGPVTTFELKDLAPITSYEIGVRTVVAGSKSIWSPIMYVSTRNTFRMDPPTVSERRPTSLRVNWKASKFPDDNTVIGYKVRYRPAVYGQNVPSAYTEVQTGTETTIKITGLEPNSSYEISVQALGTNGNSLWSEPTHVATYTIYPINKPTNIITSERTNTSFRVSWQTPDAAEGITITRYKVRYRQAVVGHHIPTDYTEILTKGTETTIQLTGLRPNITYEIGIQALGADTSSHWSDPVYTSTYNAFPIDAPTNIASYDITPNSFRLRWKAPDPTDNIPITGYEVRYRIVVLGTNPSQPYATAKTTGPETTIKITGLTPLNVYEVGVRALSTIGNSLWSRTYWTATAPPPPVITKTAIAMDSIIVNELHNTQIDAHDWVELRNISEADVTFDGWSILIASNSSSRLLRFPLKTTLPAGEVLLLLNTDPSTQGMPLATPEDNSHRYLVMPGLVLPQEDWTMILRGRTGWEDVAGNYFFEETKPSTAPPLTVGKAWHRTKPDTHGYKQTAWSESGYQNGLGYDDDADATTSLGTPGYLQDALTSAPLEEETVEGDLNGDGVVNVQDMVLLSVSMGQTGENPADLNGDGVVNIQDLVLLSSIISN